MSDESLFFQPRDQSVMLETGWDVSPDGRRVLVLKDEGHAQPPQFDIVLNWFDEVKRLVPTK